MRNHRRNLMFALIVALVVTLSAPMVEAGGVSMHLGSGGFGVSVGFGDWGIYTRSWSDPFWSIDFNATLAGYGQWVRVSGLGRVWRPWVSATWRPYTHGRWVSTSFGMTWVAYEPWGYVPHHYGSWAYASFGWVWVPGYTYSCANVVWVGAGGHVGWYARPPLGWSHAQHGFRHGYRHGVRDGYHNGYDDGWHDARYATYVDWRHFGSDNVSRHAVTHNIASQNHIEARAKAPSRDEIRQRGGAAITETQLSRRSVRVDGREVTIARPEGVARSIERNAAETVGRSLSEEALQRRQPQVRPRTTNAVPTAARSLRSASVSRDTRSSQAQRSAPDSSSSPKDRTRISSRSTFIKPSAHGFTADRTKTRASASASGSRRESDDSRHFKTRASGASGATGGHRLERVNSASNSSRSSARKPSAQPSRQTHEAYREQVQAQRPATTGRRVVADEQKTPESPRAHSRSKRSQPAVKNHDTDEKVSEKRPQRRRR
ncbi:MAG: hypothetical protein IFK92_07300 [Acidobacteria bacterium]|nr:hypothetical protein [Candidatus Sulfomarinibacter kjeldsenii]